MNVIYVFSRVIVYCTIIVNYWIIIIKIMT